MHTPLVSCETLFENLDDWVIFDCRHDLLDEQAGPMAYVEEHIPGALHAHIDHDLSAPVGDGANGRHPLPDPERFVKWLQRSGLNNTTQVVVYDDGPGTWASRLWWLLTHYGHEPVAVLDGGLARWKELNLATTSEAPSVEPGTFDGKPGSLPVVSIDDLDERTLLDARAPARFLGEEEPIDPAAGHIPGALNVPFMDNIGPDGLWLSPDELRAKYEDYESPVVYCGSGVTAAHGILAMVAAGLEPGALYPASWSGWCHAGRPVEAGDRADS